MDDSCAVCADTLEWVAYGSCGHRDVCSTCVARLRFICDDRRCCICKTDSQVVFVTKAMGDYTKMVNDFSILPTQLREGKVGAYWYHEDTQAFFDDAEHYKMIRAMCRLSCSVCDKEEIAQQDGPRKRQRFRNIGQLKGHLSHQHRLFMCDLCLEGRKVFICEQKLYSRAQLNQHKRTGDSEVDGSESERGGFAGHPMCEFCRSSFYGENELYSHMSTEHYTCHICQRQNPGQYEYYKDYDDLETHFRHGHFLCEDEACLVKKFIVFQSEAELKRHNAMEHGGRMSRSKRNAVLQIPTSFRYRSSNESGFHRGRRRSFRRESSPDHELSQAIEASLIRVNASDPVAGPPASTAAETPESNDIDSLVQPFDSLSTTDSSRYRQAVSQISTNASLGETSFPPLSTGPSSSQQKSQQESQNSMAARLRRKNKATVLNVGQSRPANSHGSALATSAAWPAPNVGQSRPANSRGSASATWPAPAPSAARPAPLHVSSSSSGPRKPSSANSSGTSTATASSAAWPAPLHVSSSSSGPRKPSTANSSGTSTAPGNSAAWPAPLNVPSSRSGLRKPDTANGSGTSSYAKSVHNRPVNEPGLAEGSSWGSRNLGSANRLSHSNSAPNLIQSKSVDQMSEFPPVSAAAALAQPNKKIEDVQTANKSLVERMRAALDYDENKFSAFREISQEYRQGSVGTWEYLQYVKQFGLTHLVIDLARLCPDTRKQEELIEAYNSTCQSNGAQEPFWGNGNLNSSGSSGSRKNKGKKVVDAETSSSKEALADSVISTVKSLQSQWKPSDGEVEVLEKDGYRSTRGISAGSGGEMLVELHGRNRNLPAQATGGTAVPTSGDGGSKQKKTSKFHRIRLGDGSAAALLDVRNSSDPSSADTTSGWPKPSEGSSARSVWGNGAGQKLFAK